MIWSRPRMMCQSCAFEHPKVVAVGKLGLTIIACQDQGGSAEDDARWKEKRETVFRQQLELAEEFQMNVVIHQRWHWNRRW